MLHGELYVAMSYGVGKKVVGRKEWDRKWSKRKWWKRGELNDRIVSLV